MEDDPLVYRLVNCVVQFCPKFNGSVKFLKSRVLRGIPFML